MPTRLLIKSYNERPYHKGLSAKASTRSRKDENLARDGFLELALIKADLSFHFSF